MNTAKPAAPVAPTCVFGFRDTRIQSDLPDPIKRIIKSNRGEIKLRNGLYPGLSDMLDNGRIRPVLPHMHMVCPASVAMQIKLAAQPGVIAYQLRIDQEIVALAASAREALNGAHEVLGRISTASCLAEDFPTAVRYEPMIEALDEWLEVADQTTGKLMDFWDSVLLSNTRNGFGFYSVPRVAKLEADHFPEATREVYNRTMSRLREAIERVESGLK